MTKIVIPLTPQQGWTLLLWSVRVFLPIGFVLGLMFDNAILLLFCGLFGVLVLFTEILALCQKGIITMRTTFKEKSE